MKILLQSLIIMSICFSLNLTIIDYHDPIANHILDAEVVDNILIVSAMIQGIEIYDITNPTELNHIAHFTLSGGGGGGTKSNCVSASGSYAYFTSSNGVYVINISNPSDPLNNGSIPGTGSLILENLKVKDDVLAVCAHEDGVLLYSLSNPSNPSYSATIPTENAWAVELSNGYAYIADEDNLLVVDISNINLPVMVTTIEAGNAIKDVLIDDNLLYIALGSDGINIYDISDSSFPIFLDNNNTSTLSHKISAFDGKLAVADWDDVEVLEWNGSDLQQVGYKNTSNRTMAIATKENYIYSAEWASVQLMEFGEVEGPDIDLNSTYIIYPYVENGNYYSEFIDVYNNGSETLIIIENYTTNSEFMIINPLSVLDIGDSQTIELMYTASDANASGAYRIYSNDPDQNEIICQLIGNVDGANVGEPAPNFNLEYVANGEGFFQLSEYIGKVIVLAFFSPM